MRQYGRLDLINGKNSTKLALKYHVEHIPLLSENGKQGYDHKHYAGHVLVDDMSDGYLFFWLVKNRIRDSEKRKVLTIWLNGGPGISSMDGMLLEVGPYKLVRNARNDSQPYMLKHRKYDPSQLTDILFLDQPFGTGFSFITSPDSYLTSTADCAKVITTFLNQIYKIFPEYNQADLYIAGESYAGIYIPYLTLELTTYEHLKPKGIIIGNPWLDPVHQYPAQLNYAKRHGLIDDKGYARLKNDLDKCMKLIKKDISTKITYDSCENIIFKILEANKRMLDASDYINSYNVHVRGARSGMDWPAEVFFMKEYLDLPEVKLTLNAKRAKKPWSESSSDVFRALNDDPVTPSISILGNILDKNIKITLFAGDADLICNYMGLEDAIAKNLGKYLPNSKGDIFKSNWTYDSKILGQGYFSDKLTYVKVHNGSHMLGYDHPLAMQGLLQNSIYDSFSFNHTSNNGGDSSRDLGKSNILATLISIAMIASIVGAIIFFVGRFRHNYRFMHAQSDPFSGNSRSDRRRDAPSDFENVELIPIDPKNEEYEVLFELGDDEESDESAEELR